MVTAGIFMVARMSPLFELSETALSFVLVIGATTALFMGFLGIVQNDIKRVVAYSTLSQLGYMTVALGVSAYSAAVFHLMTHAFFKALLFLGRFGDHRHASRSGHAQHGWPLEVHADHLDHFIAWFSGFDRVSVSFGFLFEGYDH
jgi:NADH:ubiquinone oxidoreductase subunit 5 (subunit L)/multisubunit Na+/H+ antiporter MnhA subunit